jgi:Zn-dependent M28 family amino/carboxypeptidase
VCSWSQGYSSEPIPFDGRSDYVGFTNLGIPAGGIFAGPEGQRAARMTKRSLLFKYRGHQPARPR